MERGPYGRDLSLSIRMLFVSVVLLALYAGLMFLSVWFAYDNWSEDWRSLGVPFVVPLGIYLHFAVADRLVLSAVRAKLVERDEAPDLHGMVERLAGMADLPMPRIAVAEIDVPNAFAAGIRQSRATVVVTRGLLERLEPPELEAVLGHELAHIANRDAMVVTAAGLFPTAGAWLGRWRFGGRDFSKRERDFRELLIWPFEKFFGFILFAFGTLLTLRSPATASTRPIVDLHLRPGIRRT